MYNVDKFLEKNRDTLGDAVRALVEVCFSSFPIIFLMFRLDRLRRFLWYERFLMTFILPERETAN